MGSQILLQGPVFHNASIASGAKAYFYLAGTTTTASVFFDEGLTTPAPNPLVSDAGGYFPQVFAQEGVALKVLYTTQQGVEIRTHDPAPRSTGQGNSAAGIDFSPQPTNTAENVQQAIENVTGRLDVLGDAGAAGRAILAAQSFTDVRRDLGLGSAAYLDASEDFDDPADDDQLPTRGAVRSFVASEAPKRHEETIDTWAVSTLYTFAHGFGAVPWSADVFLVCTTAEANYAVGEWVKINPQGSTILNDRSRRGVAISMDDTNVYLGVDQSIIIKNKDQDNQTTITPANWSLVVRVTE
jgi:hypothetical protein